jgi:tRNA-modifying protein YgfZ
MNLSDLYNTQGVTLAPDGIPLHFGNLKAEYTAALTTAVLLDRSHEGRISATGRDRFALPHRMSTNDLLTLTEGEGRPTLFTTANARILDRAVIYRRRDEALIFGEAGRGPALLNYLQRNVFFSDQVQLVDLAAVTQLFALHGPKADTFVNNLVPGISALQPMRGLETNVASAAVFVARNKSISGAHWSILVPNKQAVTIWSALLETGRPYGLLPAGSLTYNTLRIRAGRPGVGRELSADFIPLEVGLWDEVSFTKGCYTGQEIIARMESRGRLAKTIVCLNLAQFVDAPAEIYQDGRRAGILTSSVVAPNGDIFALGVVKTALAQVGQPLTVGPAAIPVHVAALAGNQPLHVDPEEIIEGKL